MDYIIQLQNYYHANVFSWPEIFNLGYVQIGDIFVELEDENNQ